MQCMQFTWTCYRIYTKIHEEEQIFAQRVGGEHLQFEKTDVK